MLELELKVCQDENRTLKADLHEVEKKTDILEVAKVGALLRPRWCVDVGCWGGSCYRRLGGHIHTTLV